MTACRVAVSHCVRARREFAPAGDPLSLLVQRKWAKKAPPISIWVSAVRVCCLFRGRAFAATRLAAQTVRPFTAAAYLAHRGVLHRSAWRRYRPATTRRVSLNTRVQLSSQPMQTVQGPLPHANGAVKYASVQRGMRHQAKVALFEPRGELLRKQCRGARSRHALVTPKWVFRCFLCFLSLHQQRKGVAGRGEHPAGSHAVRKHNQRIAPQRTAAGATQ
jgi:hypothetical protein